MSNNFPLDKALSGDIPVSPSLSGTPAIEEDRVVGGDPTGGFIITAWVITLLTALIAFMLASPDGEAAFCRERARRLGGSIGAEG
jgi:hypothetical protein